MEKLMNVDNDYIDSPLLSNSILFGKKGEKYKITENPNNTEEKNKLNKGIISRFSIQNNKSNIVTKSDMEFGSFSDIDYDSRVEIEDLNNLKNFSLKSEIMCIQDLRLWDYFFNFIDYWNLEEGKQPNLEENDVSPGLRMHSNTQEIKNILNDELLNLWLTMVSKILQDILLFGQYWYKPEYLQYDRVTYSSLIDKIGSQILPIWNSFFNQKSPQYKIKDKKVKIKSKLFKIFLRIVVRCKEVDPVITRDVLQIVGTCPQIIKFVIINYRECYEDLGRLILIAGDGLELSSLMISYELPGMSFNDGFLRYLLIPLIEQTGIKTIEEHSNVLTKIWKTSNFYGYDSNRHINMIIFKLFTENQFEDLKIARRLLFFYYELIDSLLLIKTGYLIKIQNSQKMADFKDFGYLQDMILQQFFVYLESSFDGLNNFISIKEIIFYFFYLIYLKKGDQLFGKPVQKSKESKYILKFL